PGRYADAYRPGRRQSPETAARVTVTFDGAVAPATGANSTRRTGAGPATVTAKVSPTRSAVTVVSPFTSWIVVAPPSPPNDSSVRSSKGAPAANAVTGATGISAPWRTKSGICASGEVTRRYRPPAWTSPVHQSTQDSPAGR